MNLLTKMRTLNQLLQDSAGHALNFAAMSEVLRDTTQANVYLVSRKGKILGHAMYAPIAAENIRNMVLKEGLLSAEINQRLLEIKTTYNDGDLYHLQATIAKQMEELFGQGFIIIAPIIGGGNRLGTLILSRSEAGFNEEDLILAEYGSTIFGIEILRMKGDQQDIEARNRATVHVAVGSLSFSELEAVEQIFEELNGKEGLLVASKIADRAGITRSVIVNALRKLESAGVIETRSLGMKGTYIRILNEKLIQELEKIKTLKI